MQSTRTRGILPNSLRNKFWMVAVFITAAIALVLGINSTVAAQAPTANLTIQSLSVSKTSEDSNAVTYRATATVANTGDADFSGVQRIDYQINNDDRQLAYIVTALTAGDSASFTFNFDLKPGDHTIRVILGDVETTQSVTVPGSDINVKVLEHRTLTGSQVEFDIRITNSGDLTAEDLTLSASWQGETDATSGSQTYDGDIPSLAPQGETTITMSLEIQAGSYTFTFETTTSTIEIDAQNNSTQRDLDIEFVDLQVTVLSTESLGWDGDGSALMAILVEVENVGVDDSNTFYIGIECKDERTTDCATSQQSDPIPAGEKSETELRLWLPIGDTATRIFAVEDEDTFRWGDANAIDFTITAPTAPELTWTLVRISQPTVTSYWSDGTANVELNLTLANNGTDEPYNVTINCTRDESAIEGCSEDASGDFVTDTHPTVANQVLRLPPGETTIMFDYGGEQTKSATVIVPERIAGVDREVWDCFTDTSNIDPENEIDDYASDEGIGCAGWDRDFIIKWPVGEPIQLWADGNDLHLDIMNEVLDDVRPLLNVDFETVENKDDAQLIVHTGVARDNAEVIGLDCTDFGGCAQTQFDDHGKITSSNIVIWLNGIEDEKRRDHTIRATTLHELLHALTNIEHRHHDRTSVMSYEALDYTTVDGMDLGLFTLIGHPLVQPGMTFNEVQDLIIFTDELNDPPKPVELSAPALLRRAHATLMDAESVSFRVIGEWPGCRGTHDFGPAQLELANFRPYSSLWRHFNDGTDRYYYVGNPTDWSESEWWLRRGRTWQDVGSQRVSDSTTFRGGFSSPLQMLAAINIYAGSSDYSVYSRTSNNVEIEIELNQPNPSWSRGLDLQISISINPNTYQISEYELHWAFNPRNRNSCDRYSVRASSPIYGLDFTFPDAIWQESTLLVQPKTSDEMATQLAGASNAGD